MRISGLVVAAPDVVTAERAWQRLGIEGLEVEVEVRPGEPGLVAVDLAVEDVAASERLLQRRGLSGAASGFDLGGTTWRLVPDGGLKTPVAPGLSLDHLVVNSSDVVRSAADFGARLGLDLRLDRVTEYGYHGLFFRCGESIVEVIVPQDRPEGPDLLSGVAWRCADLDATHERLLAEGVDVSGIRAGRKPGTRVATVRDRDLAVPTLLMGSAAPGPRQGATRAGEPRGS